MIFNYRSKVKILQRKKILNINLIWQKSKTIDKNLLNLYLLKVWIEKKY